MFSINLMSRTPVYEQIIEQLGTFVLKGVLKAGDQIPSVRSLSIQLSINPNTIQKAYRDLESEGYTYTVAGKGTFVAEHREILNTRQHELLEEFDEVVEELCFLSVSRSDLITRIEHAAEGGEKV